MILTKTQQKVLNHVLHNKGKNLNKRAMLKDFSKLWPHGKVAYTFAETVGKDFGLLNIKSFRGYYCYSRKLYRLSKYQRWVNKAILNPL